MPAKVAPKKQAKAPPDPGLWPGSGQPRCSACGLCDRCAEPFLGGVYGQPRGAKAQPVMIVSDYVTFADEKEQTPFSSPQGRYFYALAMKSGLPVKGAFLTYAVRCCPGVRLDSASPVRHCRDYLLAEIERVRPRAILMVGNRAFTAVLGRSGVAKNRMTRHEYAMADGTRVPCVVTFSPAYVMAERSELPKMEQDLAFFRDLLRGDTFDHDTVKVEVNPPISLVIRLLKKWADERATVAVDYETDALDVSRRADYRVMMFAASDGTNTIALELDQCGDGTSPGQDRAFVARGAYLTLVKKIMTNPAITKVAHNAKFEMHVTRNRIGAEVCGTVHCTMVLHSLLHPVVGGHDLDTVVSGLFDVPKYKSITAPWVGEAEDAGKFALVPLQPLARRCGLDAYWTKRVFVRMTRQLRAEVAPTDERESYALLSPQRAYRDVILPGLRSLYRMEATGIHLDDAYSRRLSEALLGEMDESIKRIRKLHPVRSFESHRYAAGRREVLAAGKRQSSRVKTDEARKNVLTRTTGRLKQAKEDAQFNPSSPRQVAELLYSGQYFTLDTSSLRKTPSGGLSTDREALASLVEERTGQPFLEEDPESVRAVAEFAKRDPFVAFCLDHWAYQSALKSKGTYVDAMLSQVGVTGAVHTTYNLLRARTSRMSSSDPNLMNLPTDVDGGNRFKRQFVPRPGYAFVEFDYKQIELVVLAALSGDENMIRAFLRGDDLHKLTAMRVFNLARPEDVTKDMRRMAKAVNFGVVYGETAYGLARSLRCDEQTAQDWIDGYYGIYPGVKDWQDRVMDQARQTGRVYTLFGTWRLIENARIVPDGNREDERLLAEAMRQAINSPVQGTAGLCALVALTEVRTMMDPDLARALTNVHDSNLFEVKEKHLEEAVPVLSQMMVEAPMRIIGPAMRGLTLSVDCSVGKRSWGEMTERNDLIAC